MKLSFLKLTVVTAAFSVFGYFSEAKTKTPQTIVSIEAEKFLVNGNYTYLGRSRQGYPIEGLIMNSRMVQGIFDDLNPETAGQWKYPDTQIRGAKRNTNEFIAAMGEWYAEGLLAFTLNLQGGSPLGYGYKSWSNPAIDTKSELRPEYMSRLVKILNRTGEKGMAVILESYYFRQDQFLEYEVVVIRGILLL